MDIILFIFAAYAVAFCGTIGLFGAVWLSFDLLGTISLRFLMKYCDLLWKIVSPDEIFVLLWKIVSYCARLWVIVEYYELLWRIVCYYKELLIDYEKYLTFVNCLYPWFACNFSLFFTENNKVQKVSLLTFSVDEKILYLVQTFFKTLTVFRSLFCKRWIHRRFRYPIMLIASLEWPMWTWS